jgi:hypothetical protein
MQANFQGIVEPCLDTNKYQVQQTLHNIAKQTFDRFAMDMASSPVTAANNYQPRGVKRQSSTDIWSDALNCEVATN